MSLSTFLRLELERFRPGVSWYESKISVVRGAISSYLKEEVERLSFLASPTQRGLEIVYQGGRTNILLSSRTAGDARQYLSVLESVYGELKVATASLRPAFLKEIPNIVRLVNEE